jgi:hypothetical protein
MGALVERRGEESSSLESFFLLTTKQHLHFPGKGAERVTANCPHSVSDITSESISSSENDVSWNLTGHFRKVFRTKIRSTPCECANVSSTFLLEKLLICPKSSKMQVETETRLQASNPICEYVVQCWPLCYIFTELHFV